MINDDNQDQDQYNEDDMEKVEGRNLKSYVILGSKVAEKKKSVLPVEFK